MLAELRGSVSRAERDVREGRLQRSMAVVTAFAAIVSGGEAYSQHIRGAFDHWLMWTPVWLTPPMTLAAVAALFNRTAARTLLPFMSLAIMVDGILGFGMHLRGIGRMPGGFRAGAYNIVMGPPIFAPLLTCTVGFLGLFAAGLRRER
jgi:hypothetical protein